MAISESAVNTLLHQWYGFEPTFHGRNTNKSRVIWRWLHEGKVLVPDVLSWKLPTDPNAFNSDLIAGSLGLEIKDFENAVEKRYSQSCLLLVLFIHQVHRHLEIMGAGPRQNLLDNYRSFLSANAADKVGNNCSDLLKKSKNQVNEIANHPDTNVLGQELLKIIRL